MRSGRRYLVFVRPQSSAAGRYAAVARPDLLRKKNVKAVLAAAGPACPGYCGKLIRMTVLFPDPLGSPVPPSTA